MDRKAEVLFAKQTVLVTSKVWIEVPGREQSKSFWGRLRYVADASFLFLPEGTSGKIIGKPTPCLMVGNGARAVLIKVEDVQGVVVCPGDPADDLELGANVWVAEEDGFDPTLDLAVADIPGAKIA